MPRFLAIDKEKYVYVPFVKIQGENMVTSNLKYIMSQKGVSINKLAELSGVSDHTILRARRTSHIGECKLNTLEKISRALGCKIKDIFEEER